MPYVKLRLVGKMAMPVLAEVAVRIPKPDPSMDTGPAPIVPLVPATVVPRSQADVDPEGSPAFQQLLEKIHDINGHRAIDLIRRLEDPIELHKVRSLEAESPKKQGGRTGVLRVIAERLAELGAAPSDPSLEL